MKKAANAIPDGWHTITPGLTVRGGAAAIDFYKKALGAEERARVAGPDGGIIHSELKIGDSIIMLHDEMPDMNVLSPAALGSTTVAFYLYVKDCDAAFKRAVDAGATVDQPLTDMFWGDRVGKVKDPFGHMWSFATHKLDLTDEEILEGQKKFFAAMEGQGGG